jgi:hypothetical protein
VLDGLKIDLAPSKAEKKECIQYGQLFVEKTEHDYVSNEI